MRRTFSRVWTLTAAFAMAAVACGDDDDNLDTNRALVRVGQVAPGATCASGGVEIASGADSNASGVLDDDEVITRDTVCNGTSGTDGLNALTNTIPLAPGDVGCAKGGVRVQTGIDNGDGGGTSGDGVLQAGEIDGTQVICSSSLPPRTFDPPASPAGAYTINTSGGAGTTGGGGNGGYLDIELSSGSEGGHIKFFNTGVADASFTFPATIAVYFGAKPLVVASALMVKGLTTNDTSGLTAGDIYTYTGSDRVWRWTGTVSEEITGIDVQAGATLTFAMQGGNTSLNVFVKNDVRNGGTITTSTLADTRSRGSLRVDCDDFVGTAASLVDLHGDDAAAGSDGGNGGSFYVDARDDDLNNISQDHGAVYNRGIVNTSGGAGDAGGSAGTIDIYGYVRIINTANMTAVGGRGNVSNGGNGANIYFESSYGNAYNAGDLNASGGDGAQRGGSAGYVYLYIGYPGDLLNSGDLTSNGGNVAAGCTVDCSAGSSSYIYFYIYGGKLISSGTLTSRGGNSPAGSAGDGGYVYFGASYDSGWTGEYQPVGDLVVSGNIDTRGGSGTSGGSGGYVEVEWDMDSVPLQQEIQFLGYTSITTDGGDGVTAGGPGGYVYAYNDYYDDDRGYGFGGAVLNNVPVFARGGDATAGGGGNGGYVDFETDTYYGYQTNVLIVRNDGALDLRGGNGTTGGGAGGAVYLWGYNAASNSGAINVNGGNATAGSGGAAADVSSNGSGVFVLSDLGAAVNTGAITGLGGSGGGAGSSGGDGAYVEIVGYSARNTGALDLRGGNGDAASGFGGEGGSVYVFGVFEGATNTATSIQVDPGTGNTPGANGEVFVDAQNVTSQFYP